MNESESCSQCEVPTLHGVAKPKLRSKKADVE